MKTQLPDSVRQMNERGDIEVQELCERLGYGFVMDSAARQWKQKDPIGAFTIGPCVAIAEAEAERAMKLVEALKTVRNRMASRNIQCDKDEVELNLSICREAISAYMKSEG